MTTRLQSLVTLLFTLSGCARGVSDGFAQGGAESSDGSDGSDGSGDDGGSQGYASEVCEQTHECVHKPFGWNGPVVLVEAAGEEETACDAEWSESMLVAYTGVEPAPTSCACGCSAPQGGECSSSTTLTPYAPLCEEGGPCFDNAGCQFAGDPVDVEDGWGTPMDAVLPSRFIAADVKFTGGGCDATSPALINPDPPKLTDGFELCAPAASLSECDDGLCVPDAAPGQSVCVWEPGDLECPAGFSEKTVLYFGTDDQRECASCECGAPQERSCPDAEIRFVDSGGGAALDGLVLGTIAADGGCQAVEGIAPHEVDHAVLEPGEPAGGSCEAIPGEVVGEVVLADPVTVCCQG